MAIRALHSTEGMATPQTLSMVHSAIDAFVGGAEQFSDIALLDFVWKGSFCRR